MIQFSSLSSVQMVLAQDIGVRSHATIKQMLMADANQVALVQTQDMQLTVRGWEAVFQQKLWRRQHVPLKKNKSGCLFRKKHTMGMTVVNEACTVCSTDGD